MISAYDRFFGGPESVGLGLLGAGREGNGLLPFAGLVPALPARIWGTLGLSVKGLLSGAGPGFDIGLSLGPPSGRSAGRGDGLGEFPLGFEDLSDSESTRATLAPDCRISSSALRFGNAALGRDTGVGDADGFSPVMDAIKSRIGIVTDAP